MDEEKVIVFIHPDLGIGGAERLVVDAAVGLQNLGHTVQIWTSHCDPAHCFDECRDGTLKVVVRGNRFPTSILGRFSILCAIVRQLDLITYFLLEDPDRASATDLFFVDQLSVCVPILRYFLQGSRTLFYCHFPDKLLASRKSIIKSIYRIPFDWIEGYTTGLADGIVVNSKFTAGVFKEAFPRINVVPRVVYPCVDVNEDERSHTKLEGEKYPFLKGGDRKIVLSINRFERKKNIGLVVSAFAGLTGEQREKARLIVAGGYDNRVAENVDYHSELEKLCDSLDLRHATCRNYISSLTIPSDIDVLFLPSVPSSLKSFLLRTASILAYTPENEHFGIVPLEAMLAGTPVLATNTGGPLETVLDGGVTGWLRPPEPTEWTRILNEALFKITDEERTALGERAKSRVKENFSKESMAAALQTEFEILDKTRRKLIGLHDVMMPVIVSTVVVAGLLVGVGRTDWAYVCGFMGGGVYATFGLLTMLAKDMNPRIG
ncbi:Alpha-1,3-mannosyltransferase-like protein [Orbilia oligospora]|uniref:Alpha-1,3/1,6-mannosyltransferase ALG2 n=1 Tax=Orbilia oligospora TaxID=2813651 RepID=A0A6G1MNQ5_ORBOL|nr:Alpha-1,3-mannosyltransferase-like protein [Orbilia oligospora]KAF3264323.1 Alpha-1,3-mannosyltransferase-like protein [Orbilia oligospora]